MANNVNNGITGVIDIPGALRSRGAADGNQVGGVVAYAGDIYDVSKSKNQAAINSEVSSAIDNIQSNLFSGDYDDLRNKPTLPVTASNGGYVLGSTSIAHGGSFAEGYQAYAYGSYSHAEGMNTLTANGMASHVEGNSTKSNGGANHAEGYITKSYGTASHSEGYETTALNDYSHAEGNNTVAIAEAAHSEGIQTIAYGKASHAEGYGGNNSGTSSTNVIEVSEGPGGLCQLKTSTRLQVGDILMIDWTINPNNTTLRLKVLEVLEEASDYTLVKVDAPVSQISDIPADYEAYTVLSSCKAAYGTYSHVEGYKTTASGDYSHAEGEGTETTNEAEHASGKYNQSTPNVTQFSVGIGADAEHRANAFEVDVNGNIYIQDIGNYDGKSIANVDSLQTVITDVNTRLSDLEGIVQTGDNIVIATSPYSEFYSTNKGAEDNVIIGTASIEYTQLANVGSFKTNIIVGDGNKLNNCDYSAVSSSVIFGSNNNVTGGVCIGVNNTNQSTSDKRQVFTLLGTRLTAGDSNNITYNYNFIPYATVIGVNNNPTTFNGIYSSYQNGDWTDAGAFEVGAGKNNTSVSILAQKSDGNLYIKGVGGWDGMSSVKNKKSINTIISEFETRIAALESQIAALTNN